MTIQVTMVSFVQAYKYVIVALTITHPSGWMAKCCAQPLLNIYTPLPSFVP